MMTDPRALDIMVASMVPGYVKLRKEDPQSYQSTIEKFRKEAQIDNDSVHGASMFVPRYGGYPRYFYVEMLKALGERDQPGAETLK